MPVAPANDTSQPVLPPRPTDRSYPEPKASGLRSWPVLVIILAMIAIVVAVVLMLWPSGRRDLDGKHTTAPPPAPERMQTAPEMTPQQPAPKVLPAPPQTGAPQAPQTDQIDPLSPDPNGSPLDTDRDDDDDLGLKDPFASPHAPSRGHPQLNGRGIIVLAMMEHMCRKMQQCSVDNPATKNICEALSDKPLPPLAQCPPAARCLQQIDAIACGSQANTFWQLKALMDQFQDCASAAVGC